MPIYTYKCTKCDKEFYIQHGMNQRVDTCQDIDKFQHDRLKEVEEIAEVGTYCEFDAPMERVIEKPEVTIKKDTGGKDLEYRVRKGIEEASEAVKKDQDSGIDFNLDEIKDKFK